jgi:hypothetical protein
VPVPEESLVVKKSVVPAVFLLAALAGCGGGDSDGQPAGEAGKPSYRVVKDGNRQITVEVDSAKALRAVFDDVRKKYTEDGGYFVSINCSTGATKSADNRLANGRFAVGSLGAAQTGLKSGTAEFEVNEGRTCPA